MAEVFQLSLLGPAGAAAETIHPTLIKSRNALVLFDAGYPGQAELLERELGKVGCRIADLTHIVASHQDHDHVGSLAALKRMNASAIVVASAIEEPYISGSAEPLRIAQAREYNRTLEGPDKEWGEAFLAYLKTVEPCAIDHPLRSFPETIDEDIDLIWTPGHTPGHVSLHLRDEGILVAGDALACQGNTLAIANPQFTLDLEACRRTIVRISSLGLARILCYHGGAVDLADAGALGGLIDSFSA